MVQLSVFGLIFLIICATSASEFDHLCDGQPHNSFVDDPRSCAGYFRCDNGVAIEGRCGESWFFNPIYIMCDWPENVDCEDDPEPTPPPPPETTPSPPPPPLNCPETGSVLIPHPQSCSLFVLCFGGTPVELECAPDQHFSEQLQTCTDPETAQCDIDHAVCEGVHDFGLIASTVNCNEYFICFNSTSIRRNCAPALHFNPTELRCESPHTAGCLILPPAEPECPDDVFFAVIPHPTSCHHFFYCINGVGELQECAPGFMFDTQQLHCDYEANAECNL